MLTSLFGELGLTRRSPEDGDWEHTLPAGEVSATGERVRFAATALLETTDTSVNDRGQLVDRHTRDLFVTGSPAEAMRAHFAVRGDSEAAGNAITLYDPMRVWAPIVVKGLSDASGQPVERLQLRDQASLRSLAVIERTRVPRRHDDTLKVYHADVRPEDAEAVGVATVLMERAHLTAVIVGPMHPESVERMLTGLHTAAGEPTWHCRELLFLLPPAAVWIAEKIEQMGWPPELRITVVNETMNGTSAVWNTVLETWNRAKASPVWNTSPAGAYVTAPESGHSAADTGEFAPAIAAGTPSAQRPDAADAAARASGTVDALQGQSMTASVLEQDGVLVCVLLDSRSGEALGSEVRAPADAAARPEIGGVCAAAMQVLRTQRQAARQLALGDHVDEIVVSAGPRQLALRAVGSQPGLYLVAVFDKRRTNLALVRYRMVEAEKLLG